MTAEERYPLLFGYSNTDVTELHNPKEVAEFICEEGQYSDLMIVTPDGSPFISTYGVLLNQIYDLEYRDELVRYLIPLQNGYDSPEEYESEMFGTNEQSM